MPAFIADGYTISGTIKANLDLRIEEVQVSYRPACDSEISTWLHERQSLNAKQVAESNAKFISDHLVKWSLAHQGSPVEIDIANCKKLHPHVANRLRDVICGYSQLDTVDGEEPASQGKAAKN